MSGSGARSCGCMCAASCAGSDMAVSLNCVPVFVPGSEAVIVLLPFVASLTGCESYIRNNMSTW